MAMGKCLAKHDLAIVGCSCRVSPDSWQCRLMTTFQLKKVSSKIWRWGKVFGMTITKNTMPKVKHRWKYQGADQRQGLVVGETGQRQLSYLRECHLKLGGIEKWVIMAIAENNEINIKKNKQQNHRLGITDKIRAQCFQGSFCCILPNCVRLLDFSF